MSDKFFVGLDLTSVEDNGFQRPISRVTLLLDDENSITAGDDTGIELLADCPHGTQAMANAILAQVKGYQYHMFDADDASLDPSAELGDGVTAGGVYSVISQISDDGSGYAGIAAHGEAELEDEYPTNGPMSQAFDRKIAKTRSQIIKTAEEIRLEVSNEIEGLSSSIDVKLNGITLRVQGAEGDISTLEQTASSLQSQITNARGDISTLSQTATSLQSQITNAQGDISTISQRVNNIRLDVSNGTDSSWIDLTINGITMSSQQIKFTGDVVFESDLSSGSTIVSGSCIRTGQVSADYIHLGGEMQITETVTSGAYGGSFGYLTGSTADGNITHGVGIMHSRNSGMLLCSSAGARIGYSSYSSVTCTAGRVSLTGPEIVVNGTLKSSDGTVITSDRNKKEAVLEDIDRYLSLFERLRPVSFRLKDRTRRHLGFIAQDVENSMREAGIDSEDFAGLVIDDVGDYGLRYEEFIPILVAKVQQQDAQIKEILSWRKS